MSTTAVGGGFMGLGVAFRAFWKALTDGEAAGRLERALEKAPAGPDLRILALLQRDGRLVDFLMEDVDGYADAQVGAAVRDIHRGCRKALKDYLSIEPALPGAEGSPVEVPAGFDPAQIRLSGDIKGTPPFKGVLKHHGWRVKSVHLPSLPGARADAAILAPAEVEV